MSSVGRWVLTHTELAVAVHGLSLQFELNGFSLRDWLVIVFVLACQPGLELFVFAVEKFQRFRHDVRWGAVEELCVFRQVCSRFVVEPELDWCCFRLFDRCFHLSLFRIVCTLHSGSIASPYARGQNTASSRSRPSPCFGRAHMSPPSLTHVPFFEEFGLASKVTCEVTCP